MKVALSNEYAFCIHPAAKAPGLKEKKPKRPRVRRIYPVNPIPVDEPNEKDVVSGRGGWANNQNQHFLVKRDVLLPVYKKAPRAQKRKISQQLVDWIHKEKGAFKKQDKTTGKWHVLHPHAACDKASQALREGNLSKVETRKKREKHVFKKIKNKPAHLAKEGNLQVAPKEVSKVYHDPPYNGSVEVPEINHRSIVFSPKDSGTAVSTGDDAADTNGEDADEMLTRLGEGYSGLNILPEIASADNLAGDNGSVEIPEIDHTSIVFPPKDLGMALSTGNNSADTNDEDAEEELTRSGEDNLDLKLAAPHADELFTEDDGGDMGSVKIPEDGVESRIVSLKQTDAAVPTRVAVAANEEDSEEELTLSGFEDYFDPDLVV